MKNIIFYLALALIITSCSDREDIMAEFYTVPYVEITKNGNIFFSEIKDTLKIGYQIEYKIKDSIAVKDELSVNRILGNDSILLENKSVKIKAIEKGDSKFEVIVTNMYKKQAKAIISLNVFENIVPVANLSLKQVGTLSPFEIEVDASKSIDGDSRFGGKIILYEYSIQDNYSDTTKLNQINYIFSSAGQKKVTVRVKDNDGIWSDEITKYIVIQ